MARSSRGPCRGQHHTPPGAGPARLWTGATAHHEPHPGPTGLVVRMHTHTLAASTVGEASSWSLCSTQASCSNCVSDTSFPGHFPGRLRALPALAPSHPILRSGQGGVQLAEGDDATIFWEGHQLIAVVLLEGQHLVDELSQWKRASSRGEAGTSGFLSVSDSDPPTSGSMQSWERRVRPRLV